MNRKQAFLHHLLIVGLVLMFSVPLFSSEVLYLLNFLPFSTEYAESFSTSKEKLGPLLVQAEEATDAPQDIEDMEEKFSPNTSNLHLQWNHNMMNIGQAWADGYTEAGGSIVVRDTVYVFQDPDRYMSGGDYL